MWVVRFNASYIVIQKHADDIEITFPWKSFRMNTADTVKKFSTSN